MEWVAGVGAAERPAADAHVVVVPGDRRLARPRARLRRPRASSTAAGEELPGTANAVQQRRRGR